MPLRLSTVSQEGSLRVSKWLKYQVLLDEEEMQELLVALEPFFIYIVSEPISQKEMPISSADFLAHYQKYVLGLKKAEPFADALFRRYFSSIFTTKKEVLYAMEVGQDKFLVKPLKPVIQLQLHRFYVSPLDKKFHSMVLGKESVSWGLQFSYPQLFQDPKTHVFSKVGANEEFPNTALFLLLSRWLRKNTMPTPFRFEEKQIYVPMRIGKKCLSWIGNHPELASKGLSL